MLKKNVFNTYFALCKRHPYAIPIVEKHIRMELLKLGIVTVKGCLCHKHSIKQCVKFCAINGEKGWNNF